MTTVKATVEVPDQTIIDLFTTACESGSGYWCARITPIAKVLGDPPTDMLQGFTCTERERDRVHWVLPHQIREALAIMASNYPRHFQDMINDNHDACTADVLLQLCVFGDLIYG